MRGGIESMKGKTLHYSPWIRYGLKPLLVLANVYLVVATGLFVFVVVRFYVEQVLPFDPGAFEPAPLQQYDETIDSFEGFRDEAAINAFGSRNLFEVDETSDRNVIVLGDSFFYGLGLDDRQTVSWYFNRLDPKNRYINLAMGGYNIHDSVARYLYKRRRLAPPRMIVFQLHLDNDVFRLQPVARVGRKAATRDFPFVWFPYRAFVDERLLTSRYVASLATRLQRDLSDQRYRAYVEEPLERLFETAHKDGTAVLIFSISNEDWFAPYHQRLKKFCAAHRTPFVLRSELVDDQFAHENLLMDKHPNGAYNERLAIGLMERINGIINPSEAPGDPGEKSP